ncbi:MAG: AraC family ligand binding domain-containing protein [Chthoniobacterales bacterium]
MSLTACGHTEIPPGAEYPLPTSYVPSDHKLNWTRGRKLRSCQIIYISGGRGTFENKQSGSLEVRAPALIPLFPNEWHRYRPTPHIGWTEDWIEFDSDWICNSSDSLQKKHP